MCMLLFLAMPYSPTTSGCIYVGVFGKWQESTTNSEHACLCSCGKGGYTPESLARDIFPKGMLSSRRQEHGYRIMHGSFVTTIGTYIGAFGSLFRESMNHGLSRNDLPTSCIPFSHQEMHYKWSHCALIMFWSFLKNNIMHGPQTACIYPNFHYIYI